MKPKAILLLILLLVGVFAVGCSSEPSDSDKKTTEKKFDDLNKNAKPGEIQR